MAALLARLYGLPVAFVHVVDEGEGASGPREVERAADLFAGYAREFAERLGLDRAAVSTEVRRGAPAASVVEMAAEARFLVIATHGRGGFKATFIGSVADKVVRSAKVPVFVIPGVENPGPVDVRTVLVALDGSPEADRALALGREIAGLMGAKVALLRVFRIPPPVGIEFTYYAPETLDSLERSAREYMAGVALPGEQSFIVQGDPATLIVQAAGDLDAGLVVMGSRGKGLATRLALGSTTDRVMHSLRRPLLIVPAAGGQ
jgi:nucleotide-binding universal stress UspA family protein